jgi:hypothetical protein
MRGLVCILQRSYTIRKSEWEKVETSGGARPRAGKKYVLREVSRPVANLSARPTLTAQFSYHINLSRPSAPAG